MRKGVWVFDLDGTVADIDHRLHHIQKEPKDWRAFFAAVADDRPISHMVDLVGMIECATGFRGAVIFVSGRSDECRAETEHWLAHHVTSEPRVYMRKAGDHRDDTIIKMELLIDIRADGLEPIMVFEDRKRVVDAWRAAGIPCAQVAPGNF